MRDKVADRRRNERLRNKKYGLHFTGQSRRKNSKDSCYIATAVYGSYDCPQVWTLRRYRDYVLKNSILGRGFIKFYYSTSPHIINLLGNTKIFNSFWKSILDRFVIYLNNKGYKNTKYLDK